MFSYILGICVLIVGVVRGDDSSSIQDILGLKIDAGTIWEIIQSFNETQCAGDMKTVLKDISHRELYALQMLDSCAKIPEGLLLGNHQFLGQYDECLGAEGNKFSGKYCLLGMDFPELNSTSSEINAIPGGFPYSFGVCVPSTCSTSDLNEAFSIASDFITLQATDMLCVTASDEVTLSAGEWVTISLLIVILVLAIASTTYEVWQRLQLKNDKPSALLISFSLYQNGRNIFEVRASGGQMDCLNGIRVLSMFWVILCHDSLFGMFGPMYNIFDALQGVQNKSYVGLSNGYLSVDTFFLLSGLLVAFVFFRDIGRNGSYDVPRSYLNRIVRLTPPLAVMILLQATLIKYFGDGPVWKEIMSGQEEVCKKYWWSALIYVHNIVNPDEMCLVQTWYLAADMQLYIIAPLILYPLLIWPKIGPVILGLLTIGASFLNFGLALEYSLPYTPALDQRGDENRIDNYVPWSRAAPWLIGVCLGYIICGIKAKKIEVKLTPMVVLAGWLASGALLGSCMFGLLWFIDHPDYTDAQSAAFLAFHRVGWALGLAWLIFACIFGYGGPINGFLSWGFFQPLAKLSYSTYLVHISVLLAMISGSRVLLYENLATLSFSFISAVVISNLAAIPMVLLVEMPSGALDRYFLRSINIFPYPRPKKNNNKEDKSKSPKNAV